MSKPLAGLRLLAAEQVIAGPFGTMLLADLGAEVVKVERPAHGELARGVSRYPIGPDREPTPFIFYRVNRNQKSVTIDLQEKAGKAIFRELVKVADVVWENFQPGTMDSMGVG